MIIRRDSNKSLRDEIKLSKHRSYTIIFNNLNRHEDSMIQFTDDTIDQAHHFKFFQNIQKNIAYTNHTMTFE